MYKKVYMSLTDTIYNRRTNLLLSKCKDITSKDQLHKRERFFIENNTCVNNVGLLNELGKTKYQKVYF